MSPRALRLLAALALLLPLGSAGAHPLAPSSLRLTAGEEAIRVRWRTPTDRPMGSELRPILPERCRPTEEARSRLSDDRAALITEWIVDCGPRGLVGSQLSAEGLSAGSTNVVVEVVWPNGSTARGLLHAGHSSWVVPEAQGRGAVFADYLRLGVEHLLTGPDHVLFILGLLLLLRSRRSLLLAITAFTAGHSVSLALAALGLVRLPVAPIEVAIALTLVALALEILRLSRGQAPWPMARWPWAVCAGFGLLHGLGFAGALAHTGLPEHAIPLSLLSFNVGIELGQLAIVALGLGVWRLLRRLVPERLIPSPAAPAYLIGALSAMWVLERGLGGLGLLTI